MTELKAWVKANRPWSISFDRPGDRIDQWRGFPLTATWLSWRTRVHTLETRGSPHLSTIDNRLTVLESQTSENKDRLERVVEIMTREHRKDRQMSYCEFVTSGTQARIETMATR